MKYLSICTSKTVALTYCSCVRRCNRGSHSGDYIGRTDICTRPSHIEIGTMYKLRQHTTTVQFCIDV